MSFRGVTTPEEAFRRRLRDQELRMRRQERGATLRGTPSVAEFRIGDVLLTIDTSGSPTLVLQAQNLLTGTPPVVIATLP